MAKRVLVASFLIFASLFISISAFAAAGCDGAGNCYIRAGATGTGNGSSWTNACASFAGTCAPSSMVRGVTYWVAAGNYCSGGCSFSAANSGSTVITIEAATTANHGPAGDWNSSYAGQAHFVEATFASNYWTVNGQSRGSDWKSGYNLKFQSAGNNSECINVSGTTGVTLKYIECQGYSPVGPSIDDAGIYGSGTNFYIGYSYVHDVGDTNFQQNTSSTSGGTWEYNWVSNDGMCGGCNHFEAYSLIGTNMTIRYNFFENIVSSGIITDASGGGNSVGNWDVYGNVFFWDPGLATRSGWPQLVDLDDGVIALFGNNYSGYFHFYNNVIEGISPNVPQNNNCTLDPISAVSGPNNWSSVTIVVENNLWDNNGANVFGGCQWIDDLNNGGTNPRVIKDHNAYAGGNNGALNADPNDKSSVQTFSSSILASASPLNFADFEPSLETSTGAPLSAPYNVDLNGSLFGSDNGIWTRGAFQYAPSSSSQPNPPTNVSVVVQ